MVLTDVARRHKNAPLPPLSPPQPTVTSGTPVFHESVFGKRRGLIFFVEADGVSRGFYGKVVIFYKNQPKDLQMSNNFRTFVAR